MRSGFGGALRVALLLLLALAAGAPGCAARPRLNVIVIVMDTTRADHCSVTGYARPTTPRLSEYARQSTVYLNAWSPAAWTPPAHASLFTGLRPEHHGLELGNREYLDGTPPTLAERLAAAGYETGCFANNPYVSPNFGLTRGFARYEGLWKYGTPGHPPTCTRGHEMGLEFAESAAKEGKPFFLFINDMEPHLPYTPDQEGTDLFVPHGTDPADLAWARAFDTQNALAYCVRQFDLFPGQIELLTDLYDAEIHDLDREIGKLLDALAKDGILDRSLLVVVADHGENLGDHHLADHRMSLNRAIRHIPLLIRMPGVFPAGRKVEDVVRLEDLMPTILDVLGLPVPPNLDGAPLTGDISGRISRASVGTLTGDALAKLRKNCKGVDLSMMTTPARAVFDGRYHYLRRGNGHEELYDIAADPREEKNLAPAGGELLTRMRELLGK